MEVETGALRTVILNTPLLSESEEEVTDVSEAAAEVAVSAELVVIASCEEVAAGRATDVEA